MAGWVVLPLKDGVYSKHELGARRVTRGEVEVKESHRAGKRREELTGSFKVSVLEFVLIGPLVIC